MRIIDLRGQNLSRAELLAAMPRAAMGTSEATDLVRPILDDVKERGAAALRDFEEKFDHFIYQRKFFILKLILNILFYNIRIAS